MPAAARCCCLCCCCCCCCSSAASLDRSEVDASIEAADEDEAVDDEGVCGCRPALGVTAGARDCTGVACGVLGGATEADEDEEDDDEDNDALRAVVDR